MKRQIAVGTAQHPVHLFPFPLPLSHCLCFSMMSLLSFPLSTCPASFAVPFNFHTDPALSLSLSLPHFRFSFYFPAVIFSSYSLCFAFLRLRLHLRLRLLLSFFLFPLCFLSDCASLIALLIGFT